MTDLDRLLEWARLRQEEKKLCCADPQTIIGLIERVKEAESLAEKRQRTAVHIHRRLVKAETRLRAAEEVVERVKDADRARRGEQVRGMVEGQQVQFTYAGSLDALFDALRHYDESVKGE